MKFSTFHKCWNTVYIVSTKESNSDERWLRHWLMPVWLVPKSWMLALFTMLYILYTLARRNSGHVLTSWSKDDVNALVLENGKRYFQCIALLEYWTKWVRNIDVDDRSSCEGLLYVLTDVLTTLAVVTFTVNKVKSLDDYR